VCVCVGERREKRQSLGSRGSAWRPSTPSFCASSTCSGGRTTVCAFVLEKGEERQSHRRKHLSPAWRDSAWRPSTPSFCASSTSSGGRTTVCAFVLERGERKDGVIEGNIRVWDGAAVPGGRVPQTAASLQRTLGGGTTVRQAWGGRHIAIRLSVAFRNLSHSPTPWSLTLCSFSHWLRATAASSSSMAPTATAASQPQNRPR
jgi:hypothetical protein